MDHRTLLEFMAVAEKLKCRTRHSWTSDGRRESVAEHTFRLMVFAWLVRDELPECSMERIMKMCLFHDIGEALTGDVPCFEKGEEDRQKESRAIEEIADLLPESAGMELIDCLQELGENQTLEARIVHALDKMEAVIQHNEAPIDTWIPLEYSLQLTYGQEEAEAVPYLRELRQVLMEDSRHKIEAECPAKKQNS